MDEIYVNLNSEELDILISLLDDGENHKSNYDSLLKKLIEKQRKNK